MSIIQIPNQQVAFNYPYDPCDSCDAREYSIPVIPTDDICFQFRQSACGNNLICDPTFNELSDTLVTNGTFLGSAAGWTVGAGWAYGANNIILTTSVNVLSQSVAITPLRRYIVRCVVSAVTGTPNLIIKLGGSTSVPAIVAAGSYTFIAVADNLDTLLSFNDGTGTATYTLDSVELYDISPCWGMNSSWDLSTPGYATHISSTSALTSVNTVLTVGSLYKVITTIANYTGGSVRAKLGTTYGAAIDANGTIEQYIYCNGTTVFLYEPTTDFVGSITYVEVKPLKTDFTLSTRSICGDVEITTATITDADQYIDDFVTMCFNPTDDITILQDCYKCFTIYMTDLCTEYGANEVIDGTFVNGLADWDQTNFNVGFRNVYALAVAGGKLKQYYGGGTSETFGYYENTHRDFYYRIKVSGQVSATANVVVSIGGRTLVTIIAPGTYEGEVTTLALTTNAIKVEVFPNAFAPVTDQIFIDDFQLNYLTYVDEEIESQPFILVEQAPCTKVIEAYCDENNFGFNFVDTFGLHKFRIKQRIEIVSVNPVYNEERTDYLFSNGKRSITFGQSEKYWTIRSGFLPEHLHDCLRVQVLCDHLLKDDVEYYDKGGDYVPDYLGNNDYLRLSSVSRDWRKKIENIFNSYCNS